jgi:TonB family protein
MGKLIAISAVLHVVALLVLPHVPSFGRQYDLAYDVYSVDLVQLPGGAGAAAEQGPEEITAPAEEPQAPPAPPEKTDETISEEPVKRPKQIAVKPPSSVPQKSLRDRISERLEKQDEKRPAGATTPSGSGGTQGTTQRGPGAGPSTGPGRATVAASRFPYSWYLSVVQGKVTMSWEQPSARLATDNALSALISFRIKRDGSIDALTVRRSSGRSTLDQSATKAVRDSAPFPPLPSDYREGYLDVTIEFTLTRQ